MIQAKNSKAEKRVSRPITGNMMTLSNQTPISYSRQLFRPMSCVPEEHSQHFGIPIRSLFTCYYADDLSSNELGDMIPMQQVQMRKKRSERNVTITGSALTASRRVSLQELLISRNNVCAKQVKPKEISSKQRTVKRCGIRHLFGFGKLKHRSCIHPAPLCD